MFMNARVAYSVIILILASTGWAETNPLDRLLIKNAVLVDREDKQRDQVITLILRKGNLTFVTMDPVPEEPEDKVIDARNGVIIGHLDMGKPLSVMILDEDPRINFDVLLDTETHAVFVMKQGDIVRNRLDEDLSPAPSPTKPDQKPEWFAYSPPPIALPISYQKTQKWNRFQSKYINTNLIGALALDRVQWLDQDGTSETQVGDLSSYDGGEIRALRFGAIGTFNFKKPWIYTFFLTTHAFGQGFDSSREDSLAVFDARVDIPLSETLSLAVGKQKEPISMERLTSLLYLPMQERSAVSDSMMPSRNVGVVLSGTAFERRSTWAGGVFNPWLEQGNAIEESSTQLIGRGTCLPLLSGDESSLLHLGAGLRYTNTKQPVQYRSTPEVRQSPVFVDTNPFLADDGMLYDLEAAWRWGPFLLNGEYVINQIDSSVVDNPMFTGFHVTASYILTREMRPYNKKSGLFGPIPIAKPVTHGGWGAWEVATRFSTVDLNDGTIDGGAMDIYSLGLNWWLTSASYLSANVRHIVLDQYGETGHSDGLMMRLTLMLE
jgi:phosphate-selective porin OprO/OprP